MRNIIRLRRTIHNTAHALEGNPRTRWTSAQRSTDSRKVHAIDSSVHDTWHQWVHTCCDQCLYTNSHPVRWDYECVSSQPGLRRSSYRARRPSPDNRLKFSQWLPVRTFAPTLGQRRQRNGVWGERREPIWIPLQGPTSYFFSLRSLQCQKSEKSYSRLPQYINALMIGTFRCQR